jgi:leucyl aminopeptidase (aminopeptidase T)
MVDEELYEGAETVVNQCLDISKDENVLILNDGNDQDILDVLMEKAQENAGLVAYKEYEEPENHGEEPPEEIADAMKDFDVVIAPTKKSLSHTDARKEACEAGARVATMPGIDKEVWKTSLQADYEQVANIAEKIYSLLEETDDVRIETPSGTELEFSINIDYFHTDTGLIHEPGEFGNLPAGESDGGMVDAEGKLVVDHFPFAPSGTEIEIKDNKPVAVKHQEADSSELSQAFEDMECSKTVAEFGFGANSEATLIGNLLQDEKVLGTVHIAFGDNTSYISDGNSNKCDIHWDTVCEDPTVYFDGEKVLDEGDPVFLDRQ